jgi:hypothetical protein
MKASVILTTTAILVATNVNAGFNIFKYYCNAFDGQRQVSWFGGKADGWGRENCGMTNRGGGVKGETVQDLWSNPYPSVININNLCNQGRFDLYNTGNGYDVYKSGGNGQKLGHCTDTNKNIGPCPIALGSCAYGMYYTCDVPSVSC